MSQTTFRRALFTLASCLALTACATRGTETINDFGRYQEAQPGSATKAQVYDLFGQPHAVRYDDGTGESAWVYFEIRRRMSGTSFIPYAGIILGGSNYHITEARFVFDSEDVLLRSRREQRDRFVNSWVELANDLTPDEPTTAVEQELRRLSLPFDPQEAARVADWTDHISD